MKLLFSLAHQIILFTFSTGWTNEHLFYVYTNSDLDQLVHRRGPDTRAAKLLPCAAGLDVPLPIYNELPVRAI
jgi:hypothetical protein